MIRYVVLGLVDDITAWRRERGVSAREVVAVSTRSGDALRGLSLSADVEVITLPSWTQASPRVVDAVERDLALARVVDGAPATQPRREG